MSLTAKDIRGVYAIMPTPAKDSGDRWDETDSVDLAEAERGVRQLIASGVDGIITTGTTGECATLLPEEYKAFVECVAETVNKRVALFCGAGALGTRMTIRLMRWARDAGADGAMVGTPMWQPATLDVAVQYFTEVAEAFPDYPLMVYANSGAFRFAFPPPFWARVAEIPTLVAAKYADLASFPAVLEAAKHRIKFLAPDGRWYFFARLVPEAADACWSTASSMGPAPVLNLRDALAAGDWDRARAIHEEIGSVSGIPRIVPGGMAAFPSWNIQMEKVRMNAAEFIKAGPVRPPYHAYKPEDVAKAWEMGLRWRELHAKHAALRQQPVSAAPAG
jgi:trans-o-hydroxybenzylidenepyruvate hydratase-aldolase